nr:hypothetical protein CFP56_30789 [Quercus suber]
MLGHLRRGMPGEYGVVTTADVARREKNQQADYSSQVPRVKIPEWQKDETGVRNNNNNFHHPRCLCFASGTSSTLCQPEWDQIIHYSGLILHQPRPALPARDPAVVAHARCWLMLGPSIYFVTTGFWCRPSSGPSRRSLVSLNQHLSWPRKVADGAPAGIADDPCYTSLVRTDRVPDPESLLHASALGLSHCPSRFAGWISSSQAANRGLVGHVTHVERDGSKAERSRFACPLCAAQDPMDPGDR